MCRKSYAANARLRSMAPPVDSAKTKAVAVPETSAYDDAVRALRGAGCVFAEREADVIFASCHDAHQRLEMVAERASGAPLEYVVGVAEFAGVSVRIGPHAFIPRHRAAALVDAADMLHADADPVTALDLGCGCGAIAAALAHRHPEWSVHATDVDAEAVAYARINAATLGFETHEGDWFDALPTALQGTLDIVVAHLPYVPTAQVALMPRDFRDAEPRRTVDGGSDGLDPWRTVAARAWTWLAPGGVLLSQVAVAQVETARRVGSAAGWETLPAPTDPARDADALVLVLVSRRA